MNLNKLEENIIMTYQDIRDQISAALLKHRGVAMMNREQIFEYLAELVAISDQLIDFIRKLDRQIAETEKSTRERCDGCSAAMLAQQIKSNTSVFIADKDWANKQLAILKDLRITALAAQRTTE